MYSSRNNASFPLSPSLLRLIAVRASELLSRTRARRQLGQGGVRARHTDRGGVDVKRGEPVAEASLDDALGGATGGDAAVAREEILQGKLDRM